MVTAHLSGSVLDPDLASFHVSGMQELLNERTAHVYWLNETPLAAGDAIVFSPVDVQSHSEPVEIKPTDSPEYLEEQRQYDEFLAAHVWPQPQRQRHRETLGFNVLAPKYPRISARLPIGHDILMCSLLWNRWKPERTRVFIRSFAGRSLDTESRELEWLRVDLQVGQELCIEVRA